MTITKNELIAWLIESDVPGHTPVLVLDTRGSFTDDIALDTFPADSGERGDYRITIESRS